MASAGVLSLLGEPDVIASARLLGLPRDRTLHPCYTCPIGNMSTTGQNHDLRVYETAREVLESDAAAARGERRAFPRHPFSTIQRIAPFDRETPLAQLTFFPVLCNDISRGGISFVLPDKIDCSRIIIELGTPPNVWYSEAAVVRCRKVWYTLAGEVKGRASTVPPAGGGLAMQLIGCRFTGHVFSE